MKGTTVAMDVVHLETDILVIGSGAAGMMAALEASKDGAGVILAGRSLIGRSGATIMVQMTVAVWPGATELRTAVVRTEQA